MSIKAKNLNLTQAIRKKDTCISRCLFTGRGHGTPAYALRHPPVCASLFSRLDPLATRQSTGLSRLHSRPPGSEPRACYPTNEKEHPQKRMFFFNWQRARDSNPRGFRLTAFPMRLLSHSVNPLCLIQNIIRCSRHLLKLS